MLALGVVSGWLALLGLALLVPAYLDSPHAPRWVAGFSLAELGAAGTGALVGAERLPSSAGIVGTSAAAVAGLLLTRTAGTALAYAAGQPALLKHEFPYEIFTEDPRFRVLPPLESPATGRGDAGCRPRLVNGEAHESPEHRRGRLLYTIKVDPVQQSRVVVRAKLTGPTWWGLGIKRSVLEASVAIDVVCEHVGDQCVGDIVMRGAHGIRQGPLQFAVGVRREREGSRVICDIDVRAAHQARSAPSLGGGLAGGAATFAAPMAPADDGVELGMGRFVWQCSPRSAGRTPVGDVTF